MNISSDQPGKAREHEVPDAVSLNNYFNERASQLGPIQSIEQFPSGYSNLTFCLHTHDKDWILRRPPIGATIKSAHDMGREFTVLSKLKPVYSKVPAPVLYCEDVSIIGAPFYVMERLSGIILRASGVPYDSITPDMFRRISEVLVDNLVEIHSLDLEQSGLVSLGKPEGYVQRQVDGWIKRYKDAETEPLQEMNRLMEWLSRHLCETKIPSFLHNDYKYDNVILNPNDLTEIVGVLDWEMATVGDPLMDLGASLAYWSEAGDNPVLQSFNLTSLPGNLTRLDVINRYAEKSKRDVSNILFYYVFGLFKNAVIAQQIYARWKKGFTHDARFGGLLSVIKALSQKGINSITHNII